jgi:Leucine carboxyl methyltransferase
MEGVMLEIYAHPKASYAARTRYNAKVADLTAAFALDLTTSGELMTKHAAGNKLIEIPLTLEWIEAARVLWKALRHRDAHTLNIAGNGLSTLALHGWSEGRIALPADAALPTSLTFVPIDFEHQNLSDCLSENGFRSSEPAFFLWLGVVPYLRRDVVISILRAITGVPGSGVVFDYIEPLENYSPERRALAAAMAERAAAVGEPVLTHFEPDRVGQGAARARLH